jgi:hypothetical protein
MQDIQRLNLLIDKAASIAGSKYKLARQIGYTDQEVHGWTKGTKTCPLEAQILLAETAGLQPESVLAWAIVERQKNEKRKEALIRALGKAYRAVGEKASLHTFASVSLVSSALLDSVRQCILC